jgi:hypothetical protein
MPLTHWTPTTPGIRRALVRVQGVGPWFNDTEVQKERRVGAGLNHPDAQQPCGTWSS